MRDCLAFRGNFGCNRTANVSENSEDLQTAACEVKPVRKKAVKSADAALPSSPRKWEDVVPLIREMKDAGATVPEIAEKLELSYVLVNQVMLQSYKMSVDTIRVFERQEKMRLGIED